MPRAELVSRVSNISKEKLENSLVAWPNYEKVIRYREVRTAAIVAEMKHRGVEVTEMNSVHLAAILCAAVPTDPAFLLPYHDAFAYEENIVSGGNAIPVDSSTEPAAQPCGGMWVGDPKPSWPEWKAVHQQTALVKTVAGQAEVAFGDHPLYSGDDFGDAEHHLLAIRAWMNERPNALFTPPEVVVDDDAGTGRRSLGAPQDDGYRRCGQSRNSQRPIGQECGEICMRWDRCRV